MTFEMPWTAEQNIFIVEAYFRQKSIHWFLDEAHFLLSGHMNSKNNIFWGSTPPEHCLQRPLHSVKCTAWVAISKTWHHWTILVRGRQRAVCDNQHRAICPGAWQVLDSTWSTERGRQGPPVVLAGRCHPHTSNESLACLQQRFPDRLIRRRCNPQWSPHSPDLNPQIFICGDT